MTKSEEKSWREYFAREASRRWVAFPWALIGALEGIMELQERTSGQKLKLMKWAMEAYNNALEEASSNAKGMPD